LIRFDVFWIHYIRAVWPRWPCHSSAWAWRYSNCQLIGFHTSAAERTQRASLPKAAGPGPRNSQGPGSWGPQSETDGRGAGWNKEPVDESYSFLLTASAALGCRESRSKRSEDWAARRRVQPRSPPNDSQASYSSSSIVTRETRMHASCANRIRIFTTPAWY
jgi:hypothetical protein